MDRTPRYGPAPELNGGRRDGVGILGSSPPASAAVSCTFDGQTGVVTGVTPGQGIAIACAGLPTKLNVLSVESSALADLVTSDNQDDEADTSDLGSAKTSKTGTLLTTFTTPVPFMATHPNAVCPRPRPR